MSAREHAMLKPTSEKLKNAVFFVILGILVLLALASLDDIITAVTPRWFQDLWGLF